jgi:hypothetical protein
MQEREAKELERRPVASSTIARKSAETEAIAGRPANTLGTGQRTINGSVAFANLVGWLDEILPASAVSQTEVRAHRDHNLCQMVLSAVSQTLRAVQAIGNWISATD